MLVDRVLVIEVARHAAGNLVKLGKDRAEQTAIAHLAQPRGEPGPRTQELQQPDLVARGRQEHLGLVVVLLQLALDQRERIIRHRDIPRDRRFERAQPFGRFRRRLGRVGEVDALDHAHQVVVDEPDGRRRRRQRRAADAAERACDAARVPEVVGHQRFHAAPHVRPGVAQAIDGLLLQLVAQDIQVAPRVDVQSRPDAHEKFLGLPQSIGRGPAHASPAIAAEPQHQARGPDVAQRTGPIFHVGLELVERVVELAVALIGQRDERVEHHRAPDVGRGFQRGVEVIDHVLVAGERPQIHQRKKIFGVRRVGPIEVGVLAHVMADLEAQIPERMEQRLDEAFFGTAERSTEDDEQVDVRMEELRLAAVAADREHRQGRARLAARAIDELTDDAVDTLGVAPQRRTSTFATLGSVYELLPRKVQRRGKAETQLRLLDVPPLSGSHRDP